MAFKLVSKLKDFFSTAVYGENTADRERKLGVAQSVIEFSSPLTSDGSADYDDRLRAVLLQASTKTLDTLLSKQIAVGIDARLNAQKLGDRDAAIEGVFYPGPANGAAGGIVNFANDNGSGQQRENGRLLDKLSNLLGQVQPNVTVYAYSSTEIAIGGEVGMAFPVTISEWGVFGNDQAPAAKNNPALKNPPAKAAGPSN